MLRKVWFQKYYLRIYCICHSNNNINSIKKIVWVAQLSGKNPATIHYVGTKQQIKDWDYNVFVNTEDGILFIFCFLLMFTLLEAWLKSICQTELKIHALLLFFFLNMLFSSFHRGSLTATSVWILEVAAKKASVLGFDIYLFSPRTRAFNKLHYFVWILYVFLITSVS